LIATGGTAAVYAGAHRNGHAVAIKVLHDGVAGDPRLARLLACEAKLANCIGHPGVVPIIDDDVTEGGCPFLVMPLLDGETLRARAARQGGCVSVTEALIAGHAVLEVLAAAHAKKVLHQDIKPDNVFVTRQGDVRVLDFGVGRFLENDPNARYRSGRMWGTPSFMPPEQVGGRSRDIDVRADVWAVGATLFRVLSGRLVHEACGAQAVLAALRPARPLAEVAPQVPEAVRAVVDRALAFRKDERWPDARSMALALRRACESALGTPLAQLPRIDGDAEPPMSEDIAMLLTRVPQDTATAV
jgi:serine/threonine-protein kinase